MPGEKQVFKIKKALKKAAHLPKLPKKVRVSGGRGSGRNAIRPLPGELPIVTLRIQVLGCKDLLAKDRGGTSDPYVDILLFAFDANEALIILPGTADSLSSL